MKNFNPEAKTWHEMLGPAMEITDTEEAKQFKQDYIDHLKKEFSGDTDPKSGKTTEEIVNRNLGYFAGYYSDEVRERVERLFICKHPIFGSIAENGSPTPE